MSLMFKSNPVGEDGPIDTIQRALFTGLVTNGTWTKYQSYHRAYKNETSEGIRPQVFQSITQGNNQNEYIDVFMDDGFNATSFFLIPDNIPVIDDMHKANISIIFQIDLSKIYPTAPHRFDAEMHNEIETILKNLDGSFDFIDTHTSLDDVYEGLDTSKVNWDDMQKFHVVRFEIEAKYTQQCEPVFASTGIICGIGVTVDTTDETSAGANDGTATANDTGGSEPGNISYLWTTIDGTFNIPGEETKKTATGLSPGTYTVVVTDSILPECNATKSGLVSAGSAFDPNAQIFITVAAITDPTQQNAINNLVIDLKADSLWDKIHYMYPFVGGTASQHSFNLKAPALFQITWSGGVTHSATGVLGNGTNGFGDTGFNPNGIVALNSFSIGVYSRTDDVIPVAAEMGLRGASNQWVLLQINAGSFFPAINDSAFPAASILNSDKLLVVTRTASNLTKGYRNAVEISSKTDASVSVPIGNIAILCRNTEGTKELFTSKEHAMQLGMEGLTPTEIGNLNTIIETFQTSLSRNV